MKIELTNTAARQFRSVPRRLALQIDKWLTDFAVDPDRPDNNVIALRGVPNGIRWRFGDWRVSAVVDREAELIEVFEIAPRGSAYRR